MVIAEITYKQQKKTKEFHHSIFRQFLKQFKNLKSIAHTVQKGPHPLFITQ
jgi:hypothetical protein